jgi:hypothetical protein
MKIFISYSRKDIEFVRKLAADLELANFDVWWDITGLQAGDDWPKEIPRAIKSSRRVIVVLTSNSGKSAWVEKEIAQALDLRKRIIPIQLDRTRVPFTLINLNPIDFQKNDNYEQNFDQLLAALRKKSGRLVFTQLKLPRSLPTQFYTFIIPIILIVILFGIAGIRQSLKWISHPTQPPAPTATSTPPATLVPTGIPGSIPARIIIKFGDGKQTSYDCPTSPLPAVLSGQEKVSLELSAEMPEETLEKLEWVSFVSRTEEVFGTGKTVSYSPTGEGIIYISLDQAIICTLNVQ